MNKDQVLDSPLAWVVGGALTASWFFGIYHAHQAHGRGSMLAALLLPPYGIYMAVEQEFKHALVLPFGDPETRQASVDTLVQACRTADGGREKFGLNAVQYDVWCECTWQMVADNWPESEAGYVAANGQNSPDYNLLFRNVAASCRATAQYLGGEETVEAQ